MQEFVRFHNNSVRVEWGRVRHGDRNLLWKFYLNRVATPVSASQKSGTQRTLVIHFFLVLGARHHAKAKLSYKINLNRVATLTLAENLLEYGNDVCFCKPKTPISYHRMAPTLSKKEFWAEISIGIRCPPLLLQAKKRL